MILKVISLSPVCITYLCNCWLESLQRFRIGPVYRFLCSLLHDLDFWLYDLENPISCFLDWCLPVHVKFVEDCCWIVWEQKNKQTSPKTNATDQHAGQNFYFIKFWLAINNKNAGVCVWWLLQSMWSQVQRDCMIFSWTWVVASMSVVCHTLFAVSGKTCLNVDYTYTVFKKVWCLIFAITLPIVSLFWKLFHCRKQK